MRFRAKSALSEPEAFSAFYSSHDRDLLRFFARRVYDAQLALDLTAETFAQAFVERHQFRGKSDAESAAWLYAIAKRRLSTYYRRGAVERKALSKLGIELPAAASDELERVEQLADIADARSVVRQGLEELDAQQQLALRLRVVEERGYAEVARTLGVSEQTARTRVSRALRALSEAIELDPTIKEMT